MTDLEPPQTEASEIITGTETCECDPKTIPLCEGTSDNTYCEATLKIPAETPDAGDSTPEGSGKDVFVPIENGCVNITVGCISVPGLVDTGASVSCMSPRFVQRLRESKVKVLYRPTVHTVKIKRLSDGVQVKKSVNIQRVKKVQATEANRFVNRLLVHPDVQASPVDLVINEPLTVTDRKLLRIRKQSHTRARKVSTPGGKAC